MAFPSTTRSGTLSAMKSSKEGPSSSVWLKFGFDEDGVARHRTCGRATRAARTTVESCEDERRMITEKFKSQNQTSNQLAKRMG